MAFSSDVIAALASVLLAALVLLVIERRAVSWVVPCVAFLPVPLVALFSPQFSLVGWHGFMHASPIYRLMNGGPVPPEEPLFAGGSLRYPWIEHWLIAKLSQLTGANVHCLSIGLEVLAYAVLLLAGGRLAASVSKDRAVIALAVLFTGFGISIFHCGLLADPLNRAFPGLSLETRVVPLDKFANLSAMPMGYAAFAVAAAAGLRLATEPAAPWRQARVVCGCALLAALVHPLSWLCILPFQGAVGLVLLAARKREDLLRLAWLAGAVVVPSVLALPYLRAVGVSESSDGWTGITRGVALFSDKLGDAGIFLAPLLVAAYVERARLKSALHAGNRALAILLVATPCLAAAYLALRFPGRNEYKFLLALVPAAAAVLGVCMRPLLERHRLLAGALLALLLTPGARVLAWRPQWEVTEPVRVDGPYLQVLDPASNELYQWIARETPPDAVFVSQALGIPALGRRSLYIAVPGLWQGPDGWGLERQNLLEWHIRRPEGVMLQRQRRALELLSPAWARPAGEVIASIQADVSGRPVFVHTADTAAMTKLDQTPGLARLFQNGAGAIYGAEARIAARAPPR